VQVGELLERTGHHGLRRLAGLAAQPLRHPDAAGGDTLESTPPGRDPQAQQDGDYPAHDRRRRQEPEDRGHRVAVDQQAHGHDQRQRHRRQHAGYGQREGGGVVLDLAAIQFPVGEGDGEPGTGDGHAERQRVAGEDDADRLVERQPLAAGPQQSYLHASEGDHRGPLAEHGENDQPQFRMDHPGQGMPQFAVLGDHQPHKARE
jgi:hypothetical protein